MTDKEIIADVASRVGVDPPLLDALINFETGGTYSPTIKNPVSSARGLIQITNAPAKDLGFRDSLHAVESYPDFKSQMYNVVLPYLDMQRRRKGSLNSEQQLFMSIFYPSYMNVAPDTQFPDAVKKVNPGINTPQDYINFVRKRISVTAIKKALPLPMMVLAGVIAWYAIKKYKFF